MPARGHNITKSMVPPKNITDTKFWLRQARKAIPLIPDTEAGEWKIYDEVISDKTIMVDIRDKLGNRCAVVIERKGSMSSKG